MTDEDFIETRNTRTGDPRKIDEWRVSLPDGGKAVFELHQRYSHGLMLFSLRSKSKHFHDCALEHENPNTLRQLLNDWVRDVIEREISAGWAEASLLEFRVEDREDDYGRLSLDLRLKLEPVSYQPDEPIGNRGETSIRRGYLGQKVVVQRALADDFSDQKRPASGSLMDPEVRDYLDSALRSEHGDPVTRSVIPEQDEIRAVADALKGFGLLLAERMSHRAIRDQGLLHPEELTTLMSAAVAGAKAPEAVPLAEGEYRM